MIETRPFRFSLALSFLLLLIGLSVFVVQVGAAPAQQGCTGSACIKAPQSGATLSGIVQIEGTAALGADFQYYKLEIAPAGTENFSVLSGLIRQQVTDGQLGVWDSASVPDGTYTIRLRVVDVTGNYREMVVTGLQVRNSSPPTPTVSESPTPQETEATPPFAVVPTAVPTIEIPISTDVLGLQGPSPTPPSGTRTPSASSGPLAGFNTDSILSSIGQLFGGFMRAFVFGAIAMAGLTVLIGVIFYVRRVL